jgi:hypothetical protein
MTQPFYHAAAIPTRLFVKETYFARVTPLQLERYAEILRSRPASHMARNSTHLRASNRQITWQKCLGLS